MCVSTYTSMRRKYLSQCNQILIVFFLLYWITFFHLFYKPTNFPSLVSSHLLPFPTYPFPHPLFLCLHSEWDRPCKVLYKLYMAYTPLCLQTSLEYTAFSFNLVKYFLVFWQDTKKKTDVHRAWCHLERNLMKIPLMLDLGEKNYNENQGLGSEQFMSQKQIKW